MTLRVSTGFKSLILGTSSFESIFDKGTIEVFTGAQPASADDAATGTFLGRVTLGGVAWSVGSPMFGLSFQLSGPYVTKPLLDQWEMAVETAGIAGWWRLVSINETSGVSYALPRVDGSCAVSGGEWTMANTTLTPGTTIPLETFFYTIPPIL